jgi:hypothetical protein
MSAKSQKSVSKSYEAAKARYAEIGVDTEAAMAALAKIPSRSTAGRATTSAASNPPAKASAAASP